jgi:hypothetical protein
MICCTACHASVPEHATYFGSTGVVCGACHHRDEAADRAQFAACADHDDDAFGFDAVGFDGSIHVSLDDLQDAVGLFSKGGVELPEFALVLALFGIYVGHVAAWFVDAPLVELLAFVVLLFLGVGSALHALVNRRLSSATTIGWLGAMLAFPLLAVPAYTVLEMIRGDRAQREALA